MQNNFTIVQENTLDLSGVPTYDYATGAETYMEFPANVLVMITLISHPQQNDWYETIKLNYGIDYVDAGGRSFHYDPIPLYVEENDRYSSLLGRGKELMDFVVTWQKWFHANFGLMQ